MGWMQGKEGSHQRAAPEGTGHSVEEQKEENRIREVEAEAGEMMAGWLQTVELGIQHVGEPRQRMPVGSVAGAESPREPLERQPRLDLEVFSDVVGIVKVHETASRCRPVGEQGRKAQQQAEQELLKGGSAFHPKKDI